MGKQRKKVVVDLDANTKEFVKKIEESLAKLVETKDELKDLKELLGSFSNTFTAFGGEAVKYANELHEALGRVENTFGKSSDVVKNFAQNSLNSFGIAESSALEMISTFGDMSSVMGVSQEDAAKVGMELTALAADLASFKNVQLDVASSGLKGIFITDADAITESGVTEALKELGIVMTDTNLEQFALSQGFKETYAQMTDAEKAALRYGFVMNATKDIQGDFAKNTGSADNQMLIFTESIKELYASFGEVLLPIFTQGIGILNQVIQGFASLDPEVKKSIFIIGGLAASIPLLNTGFEHAKTAINGMKLALGSVSLPMVAIGIGIVALTSLIIKNWDSIKQTLIDTKMWRTFSNIFNTALGMVVEVVDLFGNLLTGNWSGLWENIVNILKGSWNILITTIAGGVKGVSALTGKLFEAFGADTFAKGFYSLNQVIDQVVNQVTFNTKKLTDNAGKAKDAFAKLGSFDWKKLIDNDPTSATNKGKKVLKKIFGDIKELKIQCYQDLERDDTKGELIDGKKIISQEKINKEIAFLFENMGYNVANGAANLQKKLEDIKIKMPPHILSNSEEVALEIENTFDKIREKFGEQSDTTFSLLGTQIRQSIEDGMNPEEAAQGVYENFQKIVEKIKEVFGDSASMADFSGYGEQILQSMVSGLDVQKSSGKVLDKIQAMSSALTNAIQESLNAVVDVASDLIAGFMEEAFGGKKLDAKAIGAGLLSKLGTIAIDLGKSAISLGLSIQAIKLSLTSFNPAIAIAAGIGLIALGGALKGMGSKAAGGGSLGATGGANSSASSPGFKYANAPSYAMQKQSSQQSTNESVLRGGDVYWSGQRYEVIRGF